MKSKNNTAKPEPFANLHYKFYKGTSKALVSTTHRKLRRFKNVSGIIWWKQTKLQIRYTSLLPNWIHHEVLSMHNTSSKTLSGWIYGDQKRTLFINNFMQATNSIVIIKIHQHLIRTTWYSWLRSMCSSERYNQQVNSKNILFNFPKMGGLHNHLI